MENRTKVVTEEQFKLALAEIILDGIPLYQEGKTCAMNHFGECEGNITHIFHHSEYLEGFMVVCYKQYLAGGWKEIDYD
jgi:hypothetical protein